MRWRRCLWLLFVPVVSLAGVPGGVVAGSSATAAADPPASAGADHACVAGGGRPSLAWGAVENPIVSSPSLAVKDQAVVWFGGRWHMVFSAAGDDPAVPGGVRWNIASATSTDLAHWSAPRLWAAQPGVPGVASPDLVRRPDGTFVATYQSDPGDGGGRQARLYYRTSRDLERWSAPRRLAPGLATSPDDRMIDPAVAWTGRGLVLAYKSGLESGDQQMRVAWSPSGSLGGPWRPVGAADISVDGGTVENYELLAVAGRWRLVATSTQLDQAWVFTLTGDPRLPGSWLHWSAARRLEVPAQGWDSGPGLSGVTFEEANSAYLCRVGAWSYLFYAGSRELTTFGGWGHAAIGVARSRDLIHWEPAPAR